jgi:Family of unknown function (DUF6257)
VIRTHRDDPPLTGREAAKVTWLIARMAKRGIAGDDVDLTDLQAKCDRILNKARERANRQDSK